MIGKLLDYIEAIPFYIYYWYLKTRIWFQKRKEPKKMVLSKRQFHDPTYPPDLAELFDKNRTEHTTDRVLWRELKPEDK